MRNKRLVVLGAVLGIAAVAVVGAWLGFSRIKSPADVAARTAAPSPSPILVPVEDRLLSSNVVTRGTARFGLPQTISIAPSGLKAQPGLITTLPQRNASIRNGGVILRASGRPVFALEGRLPGYRDLVPGISGDDVRQLQRALNGLGYYFGAMTGNYDEPTMAAVAAWYRSGGWEPFGPTADQSAALRGLERESGEADKNRSSTTGAVTTALLGVESARATADHYRRTAAAEVATMTVERARIVLDPRQTEAARAAADAGLKRAEAGVEAARLLGEVAIQTALEALKGAELDARMAADRAARLTADLAAARGKLGIQVPADEIVFMPALPVRIHEVTTVVGETARGPVMSVTDNLLSIDSSLPLESSPLIKPGMVVEISEQALGVKATGTVARVADGPGTNGVDGYHIYFEVRVDQTSVPLQGFSLRLTIPIKSSQGVVTTVPVSALSLAADGTSRVQVEENGVLKYVVVEPGLSADGYVEVTPINGTLRKGQLVVVGYEALPAAGTP